MRVSIERERESARAQVLICPRWDIELFVNSQINFLNKIHFTVIHVDVKAVLYYVACGRSSF